MSDQLAVIRALVDEKAEFLVAGGYAMQWHGQNNAAAEVDIWFIPSAENVKAVIRALEHSGIPLDNVGWDDFVGGNMILRVSFAPKRVEPLADTSGIPFEEAFAASCQSGWCGEGLNEAQFRIVSSRHLIRLKQALGTDKDLADAAFLESLHTSQRPSKTHNRIEGLAALSTLLVYLIVWIGGVSYGFQRELLVLATLTALVYAGMHIFEMTVRGHCLLSADSTAIPVTLLVFIALVVLFKTEGWLTRTAFVNCCRGFAVSWIFGHVLALAYAATVDTLAKRLFRERIKREREAGDAGSRTED